MMWADLLFNKHSQKLFSSWVSVCVTDQTVIICLVHQRTALWSLNIRYARFNNWPRNQTTHRSEADIFPRTERNESFPEGALSTERVYGNVLIWFVGVLNVLLCDPDGSAVVLPVSFIDFVLCVLQFCYTTPSPLLDSASWITPSWLQQWVNLFTQPWSLIWVEWLADSRRYRSHLVFLHWVCSRLFSSVLQGTQIELSIGVTLGISTMAGKNRHLQSKWSCLLTFHSFFIIDWIVNEQKINRRDTEVFDQTAPDVLWFRPLISDGFRLHLKLNMW